METGSWVLIDRGRFKPMIGQVVDTTTHPGHTLVYIRGASGRGNKGQTVPIPNDLLQSHKANRFQVLTAVRDAIRTDPDLQQALGEVDNFAVFTDKEGAYPDYSGENPTSSFSQEPEPDFSWDEPEEAQTGQDLAQAKQALGVSQPKPEPDYGRARDFLMGGTTLHKPAQKPKGTLDQE